MVRKITFALSVATLLVGVWLIASVHSLNATCKVLPPDYTGTQAAGDCARVVSSYFMGFALAVGGLIILILALFHVVRRDRNNNWAKTTPSIPRQSNHSIGSITR